MLFLAESFSKTESLVHVRKATGRGGVEMCYSALPKVQDLLGKMAHLSFLPARLSSALFWSPDIDRNLSNFSLKSEPVLNNNGKTDRISTYVIPCSFSISLKRLTES